MYWITGILGILLGAAPFVLTYSHNSAALWTSIILGLVVLLVSIYEAFDRNLGRWEYWIAGLAGLLAIIAPFVLGFTTLVMAVWTSVVLGLIMLVLSGYEVFVELPRHESAGSK